MELDECWRMLTNMLVGHGRSIKFWVGPAMAFGLVSHDWPIQSRGHVCSALTVQFLTDLCCIFCGISVAEKYTLGETTVVCHRHVLFICIKKFYRLESCEWLVIITMRCNRRTLVVPCCVFFRLARPELIQRLAEDSAEAVSWLRHRVGVLTSARCLLHDVANACTLHHLTLICYSTIL